jgi:Holliday junction resolvase RusA-like endonuclease
MKQIILKHEIFEKPISWKRPGCFGKQFFDFQAKDKARLQKSFLQAHPNFKPLETPLHVVFSFFFQKKGVNGLSLRFKRPDLSNLIKLYEDAFNGIIWSDDAQICSFGDSSKYDYFENKILIEVYEAVTHSRKVFNDLPIQARGLDI